MKYLENPAFLAQKIDHFGHKVSRKIILELITKLLQRLRPNETPDGQENENDTKTENEVEIFE